MLTALTALVLVSSLAVADDPEGVITTAPSGVQSVAADAVAPVVSAGPSMSLQDSAAHGLSTSEQIDRWVAARAPGERPFDDGNRDPFAFKDDRKMHGEVSAGIGTGDYSAFSARVSIPFGESGRLDLGYSQSKNSPWGYGYGYGGRGGYDPRFGPSYRGHYDPFFIGEGVSTAGSTLRGRRERESLLPASEDAERRKQSLGN